MSNSSLNDLPPELIRQVDIWQKEIARLQDLVSHAMGVPERKQVCESVGAIPAAPANTSTLIDYPAFMTALEWNKGQTFSDSKEAFWEFLGMYLNQAKKRTPSEIPVIADLVTFKCECGNTWVESTDLSACLKCHPLKRESVALKPEQRQEIIQKLYSRIAAWKATGLERPLMEQAIDYADYVLSEVEYQANRNRIEDGGSK